LIKIISENKWEFLPLLLQGDEEESAIAKYLDRGELFALYDSDLKCICVATNEGGGVVEIQNIATDEHYRRQGYARKLIDYVAEHFKSRFDKIILGTGDVPGVLTFYNKCGFAVTHKIADYFTDNYDHPIIEEGVMLKDKVYLERIL
jgi:ribosomal protein S18 acetylase RimI-like enzyme